MDVGAALREHLESAQSLLENTIEGVEPAQFNAKPPGLANSIGQNYLHAVIGEDFVVSVMLKGGAPLHATEWSGKTGTGAEVPPPMQGEPEWHRFIESANVDIPQFRTYAKAVHQAALDYVGSLTANDLDREIDIPVLGKRKVNWLVYFFLTGHISNHTGEMSAMKGLVGLKGYPF